MKNMKNFFNMKLSEIILKYCNRYSFFPPNAKKAFLRHLSPYYVETKQKKVYFSSLLRVPTCDLFFLQYYNNHFAKYSVITKILSLEEKDGKNSIGQQVDYKTCKVPTVFNMHSWGKRLYDVYDKIKKDGFNDNYPIEVDSNMRIINGSHRFAVACHLNIPYVPIRVVDEECNGEDWLFVYENEIFPKLNKEERVACVDVMQRTHNKFLYPFYLMSSDSNVDQLNAIIEGCNDISIERIEEITFDDIALKTQKLNKLYTLHVAHPHFDIDAKNGIPYCTEMRFLRTIIDRLHMHIYVCDNYAECCSLTKNN